MERCFETYSNHISLPSVDSIISMLEGKAELLEEVLKNEKGSTVLEPIFF